MIQIKTQLTKKEKEQVSQLLQEYTDIYGDFYITKNNLRLFIKENSDLLFECLKRGDKIAFNEKGIILLYGFADKAPRKYVKILTEDNDTANHLLKILAWNIKEDLFAKIKKNNPLKEILEKNGFRYFKDRGKEVLLIKKYFSRPFIKKEINNA